MWEETAASASGVSVLDESGKRVDRTPQLSCLCKHRTDINDSNCNSGSFVGLCNFDHLVRVASDSRDGLRNQQRKPQSHLETSE